MGVASIHLHHICRPSGSCLFDGSLGRDQRHRSCLHHSVTFYIYALTFFLFVCYCNSGVRMCVTFQASPVHHLFPARLHHVMSHVDVCICMCEMSCAASSVPAQLLSAVDVVNLIRGITDLLSQYYDTIGVRCPPPEVISNSVLSQNCRACNWNIGSSGSLPDSKTMFEHPVLRRERAHVQTSPIGVVTICVWIVTSHSTPLFCFYTNRARCCRPCFVDRLPWAVIRRLFLRYGYVCCMFGVVAPRCEMGVVCAVGANTAASPLRIRCG